MDMIAPHEYFECLNGNGNHHSYVGSKVNSRSSLKALCSVILLVIPLINLLIFGRTVFRYHTSKPALIENEYLFISVLGMGSSDVYYCKDFVSQFPATFVYLAGNGASRIEGSDVLIESCLPKGIWWSLFWEAILFPQFILFVLLAQSKKKIVSSGRNTFDIICGAAFGEVFYIRLLERAVYNLSRTKGFKSIVLPIEGRNWERRVIRLAKANNLFCFGYTPALLTSCHSISRSINPINRPDGARPDFMLLPGKYNADVLEQAGWCASNLLVVGYLRDVRASKKPVKWVVPQENQILVILSGNLRTDLLVVEKLQDLSKQFMFSFKVNSRVAASKIIAEHIVNRGGALAQDDANCSLVLSKSATYIAEKSAWLHSDRYIFIRTPLDYCPNFVMVEPIEKQGMVRQIDLGAINSETLLCLISQTKFEFAENVNESKYFIEKMVRPARLATYMSTVLKERAF